VKVRGFVMGMKTMKTNDETIGLNLNPKHKKKDQNKNTKVKTKNMKL
jgi:hypothetical protein